MEELEFYKDFFDNAPDLFVSVDPVTAQVKNCNLTLVTSLGYSEKSEIIGKSIFELYHEECLPEVEKAFNLFRTKGKIENFRLQLKKKDGLTLHVSLNVSAVRDKQGKVIGSRSIWRDITEQIKQEEKISQLSNIIENLKTHNTKAIGHLENITKEFGHSEASLSRALNAMADGVIIANKTGEPIIWNEAGKRIISIGGSEDLANNKAETYGCFELDQITPIAPKDLPLIRVVHGDTCENKEIFLRDSEHPEGIFVLVTAHPIFDKNDHCIGSIAVIIDITERKKLELNIAEKNKELHQNNLELEKFAYITSHDLKAPLRGITSLINIVEEDLEDYFTSNKANPEIKNNLGLIRNRANRMSNLIAGILEYSKAGKTRANIQTVDIENLVKMIFDEQCIYTSEKIIFLDKLPTIKADPIKLEQVFSNLISNAIKYHHNPSEAKISIGAYNRGNFYEFSVTDNGPGIDKKYHDKIFEIFQTLQSRDIIESTGIGLSIVKKLVEHQGGKISVDSTVGEGSTFKFTWPKI